MYKAKLASIDVDGCVFPSFRIPEQADMITEEHVSPASALAPYRNMIFLNTGRSWDVTKQTAQKIGNIYVAVEHGMGYALPDGRVLRVDEIDPKSEYKEAIELLDSIRKKIEKDDPQLQQHRIPKNYFHAFRIPHGEDSNRFLDRVLGCLDDGYSRLIGPEILVVSSHGAIDIRSAKITKSTAIEVVSQQMKVNPINVVGIEDADIDHLKACGLVACPSNALPLVRDYVETRGARGYTASKPNTLGTLEILRKFLD